MVALLPWQEELNAAARERLRPTPVPRPVGNRQRTAVGHGTTQLCRNFIIEFLPFMRHGVRLSTALLQDHRGALADES